MEIFEDYKLQNLISENSTTQIYLAENEGGEKHIIKILRKECVNSDTIARYKKEFEIGNSIQSGLILKSYQYLSYKRRSAITFENFKGISLKQFILETKGAKNTADIIRFLNISKQIIQAIEVIHASNYIHRDINPTNILINTETDQVKVIDFGLATELKTERSVLKGYKAIEGTLPYISPEQTGRVNRILDFHTDYYSLGVCMYELFSGKLPFIAQNLREWVHAHVARQAKPLKQVNDIIPEPISLIVRKLMNKDAGLRYQSATGLLADVDNCLSQLKKTGNVDDFKLGLNDVSDKFYLPQKLYGRNDEIAELLNYYHDVRRGHTGFVFVKGEPGVGKSALVGELYKIVTEHNGYYTKGKFKQLNQVHPYSAIIQAFTQLVNNMLAEDKSKLQKWKELVLKKLNGNAGIITQVIPDLAKIIGKQNLVPELPAVETKNRFIVTFHDFVSTFVAEGAPLLVFLDDLQWADGASLELIQNILSDTHLGPILFIGGYREIELQANKLVYNSVKNILSSDIFTKELSLNGLDEGSINAILSDIYSCEGEQAKIVAEQCFVKTKGIPFFLLEFLKSLNKSNAIFFNKTTQKWVCDIDKVKEAKVTNNVVDLVCQNISQLPGSVQELIKVASCIGSVFNSKHLSLFVKRDSNEVLNELNEAVKASMLVPLHKIFVFANNQEHLAVEFEFLHERVRQAAYSMLDNEEKTQIHYVIGKQLIADNAINLHAENLFTLVGHLNHSIDHLNDEEHLKLTNYNLDAGKRAKTSGAFKPAYDFLSAGLELGKKYTWDEYYELKLNLYTHTAEAAYFCGEYDRMEKLARNVFKNAKSTIHLAEIWHIRNLAYQAQRKYESVENEAFDFLSELGVKISAKANTFKVLLSVINTLFALRKFKTSDLENLKPANNENIVAAMNMLGVMVYPYYGENPKLFVVMLTKLLRLTLKHGTVAISPFAFMMFGMIINAMFGKIEKGYSLGQVGLALLHKIGDKKHWAEISVCDNLGVRIWKEPIKKASEGLIEDYRIALETGDIEFAVMSLSSCSNYLFFQGENLTDILKTAEQYNHSLAHIPQSEGRVIMDMQLQAIVNLQNKVKNPCTLEGKYFSEEQFLNSGKRINDSILTNLYLLKMINAYYLGEFSHALSFAALGRKHIQGVVGIYHFAMFLFYESLCLVANYKTLGIVKQKVTLRRIKKNQAKLHKWAKHAPSNFLNKYKLVKAELELLKGNVSLVSDLYDESIALAEQNGFTHEEALANERAGMLWLEQKKNRFAKVYLSKAVSLYQLWNAKNKYQQLETKYKDHLYKEQPSDDYLESRAFTGTNTTITSETIDLRTVIEASKTISGEIVLNDLFAKTLQIIMENAGAQRGVLILKQANLNLEVEAHGKVVDDKIEVLLEKMDVSDRFLPVSLIRYIERSKKQLVLQSAYQQGNFTNDNYIKSYQIESILVLPISQQSRLLGLLYLENNLAPNVFTENQANILSLMCTQLAVSLENARVYSTLEQKVQERTAEVMSQKIELEEQAKNMKKANEKLEDLNATKDKLFSIIGHDLSNPFNAIIGFSGLLLKHLDTLDEKEVRRRIGIINDSSKKSYDLLQNLLEWSRSQLGRMEFTPTKIWLVDLVNQNLSMLGANAEAKYIVMNNEISNDLFVYADEYMLNTIVRNLVSNAIKFTDKGGEIKLSAQQYNEVVEISVADNGVGIAYHKINDLFNINSSTTTSGTDNEKGTGLGLLLCKELVEKHKGSILVQSELGIGTIIKFTIPIGLGK